MILLHNWGYRITMVGGFQADRWSIVGQVENHPRFDNFHEVTISTPREFNPETRELVTMSGNRYKLMECSGNEEQQFKYIMEDIKRV